MGAKGFTGSSKTHGALPGVKKDSSASITGKKTMSRRLPLEEAGLACRVPRLPRHHQAQLHHCEDIVDYCKDQVGTHALCKAKSYIVPLCKKTCGCCDPDPPAYCSA